MVDLGLKSLEARRLYLRTLAEVQGLEQTDLRWLTTRVWKLGVNGNIRQDVKPLVTMTDFVLQNISQMDRERSHIVPGVRDNIKVYFFDREIRQFTMQGFVYDMPYDKKQELAGLKPFAFTTLKNNYDKYMRTSAAARGGYIVELDYGQFNIYCTLTNMSATLTSDTSVIYVVSFVILVEAMTIKDNIMPAPYASTYTRGDPTVSYRGIEQPLIDEPAHAASDAIGIISREAGVKIGLADAGYVRTISDPIPAPPKLTFGIEKKLRTDAPPQIDTDLSVFGYFPKRAPVVPKPTSFASWLKEANASVRKEAN